MGWPSRVRLSADRGRHAACGRRVCLLWRMVINMHIGQRSRKTVARWRGRVRFDGGLHVLKLRSAGRGGGGSGGVV